MVATWHQMSETLNAWASRYSVIHRVWVFGSIARGEFDRARDLDLAVELFKPDHDATITDLWFEHINAWRKDLETLFAIPVQFELMDKRTARIINPAVARDGRLVYEHAA
jgi:predicted nucleotidyltransferase